MTPKRNQPFWTSVILHLVVLLGVFLATIVQAFKPKEPPHVFEMVSPPADAPDQPAPEDAPPPELNIPEVAPLEPLPEIDTSTPAPSPPPTEPPPRRAPEPAPPKPKTMTYEEFLKQNPIKEPAQRQTQPTRRNFNVPKIDVPRIVVPRATAQNPSPRQPTQSDLKALDAYNARLRSRLDAAWNKPSNLGGIRMEATVVFDVSASGQIGNVRLRPSSGNAGFDQSVKAAFARIANAGPTPTGDGHTFSMTFRMTE